MSAHPALTVHPWRLHEQHLDIDLIARSESLFALSNGHIGMRANLDEGEPYGIPGTYLNSFYEVRPLPYAEAGYGFPESGQTVLNVTNGKIIRLLVDDEPFDVRYGRLLVHERELDLRDGVLRRHVEWESPAGKVVRIDSTRLVSFTHRSAAAILYEVQPVDSAQRVAIQSELIANEPAPPTSNDPRTAAMLESPLTSEDFSDRDTRVVLVHSTKRSKLLMAAAMDHTFEGPDGTFSSAECEPDIGRVTLATDLAVGERLTMVKFLSYGWSSQRSLAAVRDQVIAAVAKAKYAGWDGLLEGQRAYLDDFWATADVELEGDTELQHAVRFALFHTLQAGSRAEQRAIPAKGLTGPGYDGHTFWDTERFVLPVLTYTAPDATRDALLWRYSTLDLARERARQLGLKGAAFPWRTIRGQECSGYWPAGTAAFHISANVADAVVRYQNAVDDEVFEREAGLEMLVETARLWHSLGHHDAVGRFRIDGKPRGFAHGFAITVELIAAERPAERDLHGIEREAARVERVIALGQAQRQRGEREQRIAAVAAGQHRGRRAVLAGHEHEAAVVAGERVRGAPTTHLGAEQAAHGVEVVLVHREQRNRFRRVGGVDPCVHHAVVLNVRRSVHRSARESRRRARKDRESRDRARVHLTMRRRRGSTMRCEGPHCVRRRHPGADHRQRAARTRPQRRGAHRPHGKSPPPVSRRRSRAP